MPAHEDSLHELAKLEGRKRLVLAQKAIERSRLLIAGSRQAVERARHNRDTADELRKDLPLRRKAA